MKKLLTILFIATFLVGCTTESPIIEKEDPIIEKPIVFEEITEPDPELEEPSEDIPEDILEKGYTGFYERVENEDKTLAYEVYTDTKWDGPCSAGYMDSDAPVYCLLRIIDLETDEILTEYESNELARFEADGAMFSAPHGWNDNESFVIKAGFGDACILTMNVDAFNVMTESIKEIYYQNNECTPGTLFRTEGKLLLLHQISEVYGDDETKIEIYSVNDLTEYSSDLYIEEEDWSYTLDLSTVKKINEMDGAFNVEYVIGKGLGIKVEEEEENYEVDFIYDVVKNEFIEI